MISRPVEVGSISSVSGNIIAKMYVVWGGRVIHDWTHYWIDHLNLQKSTKPVITKLQILSIKLIGIKIELSHYWSTNVISFERIFLKNGKFVESWIGALLKLPAHDRVLAACLCTATKYFRDFRGLKSSCSKNQLQLIAIVSLKFMWTFILLPNNSIY